MDDWVGLVVASFRASGHPKPRLKPPGRICSLAERREEPIWVKATDGDQRLIPPAPLWSKIMYQVTFSDQSLRELNKLDKLAQLAVVEPISRLTPADLANPREPLGRFSRGGKLFYRLRAGDFRFYFTVTGETLHTHYILQKASLEDFLFRTKLPVSEQQLFEQHSKFWRYLESLTKK